MRAFQRLAPDAGFAVDADADLHLARSEFEVRLVPSRNEAGGQRHAHRPDVFDNLHGDAMNVVERRAPVGHRARDLVNEHRSGHAAASRRSLSVIHRDVVRHERLSNGYSPVGRLFFRHIEQQDVAGVVLDDEQRPGAAVHALQRRDRVVERRRAEHGPRERRIQHALPDEAAVRWFVPASAARNQRHLPPHRSVGPDHSLRPGQDLDHSRVRLRHAGKHLGNRFVRLIQDLPHSPAPLSHSVSVTLRAERTLKLPPEIDPGKCDEKHLRDTLP